VASLDLIAVQTEISNEVFAALHGLSRRRPDSRAALGRAKTAPGECSLTGPVSEEYLQARALLSSFMVRTGSRGDLDRAHALFTSVTAKDPSLPPAGAAWALPSCNMCATALAGRST
jgi:hypothetical protein